MESVKHLILINLLTPIHPHENAFAKWPKDGYLADIQQEYIRRKVMHKMENLKTSTIFLTATGGGKTVETRHWHHAFSVHKRRFGAVLPLHFECDYIVDEDFYFSQKNLLNCILSGMLHYIFFTRRDQFAALETYKQDWWWRLFREFLSSHEILHLLDETQDTDLFNQYSQLTESPVSFVGDNESVIIVLNGIVSRMKADFALTKLILLVDPCVELAPKLFNLKEEKMTSLFYLLMRINAIPEIVFKAFIPDKFRSIVRQSAVFLSLKVDVVDLEWGRDDLKELLAICLSLHCDADSDSLNELYLITGVDDLELNLIASVEDIKTQMGMPRTLLFWGDHLHQYLAQETKKIKRDKNYSRQTDEWNDFYLQMINKLEVYQLPLLDGGSIFMELDTLLIPMWLSMLAPSLKSLGQPTIDLVGEELADLLKKWWDRLRLDDKRPIEIENLEKKLSVESDMPNDYIRVELQTKRSLLKAIRSYPRSDLSGLYSDCELSLLTEMSFTERYEGVRDRRAIGSEIINDAAAYKRLHLAVKSVFERNQMLDA